MAYLQVNSCEHTYSKEKADHVDSQFTSGNQKGFPFCNSSHPGDSDAGVLPYPHKYIDYQRNMVRSILY